MKTYYIINNNWVTLSLGGGFHFFVEGCGYFDNRPIIHFSLLFFWFTLKLPLRTGLTDESDPPRYGFAIHNNALWYYRGMTMKAWYFPFFTMNWYRRSVLLKDGTWEHETVNNHKGFYQDHWKDKIKLYKCDFIDQYDSEAVPCEVSVSEMEWRPKWLGWTSLFAKKLKCIDVEFTKGVGKDKGSWKGGCFGCSYDLLPNETPIECLKRMEKERKF